MARGIHGGAAHGGFNAFRGRQDDLHRHARLNDRHIAHRADAPLLTPQQAWPSHSRGDGRYVLSRKPDFIIAGPAEGVAVETPWFLTDVELARSSEFAACYRMERARIEAHGDGATKQERPMNLIYYRRICGK